MKKTMKMGAAAVMSVAALAACGDKLKPCGPGQIRAWCEVVVTNKSWSDLVDSAPGCQHTVAVTACVKDAGSAYMSIINAVVRLRAYIKAQYTSGNADFVIVPGKGIISADLAKNGDGTSKCIANGSQDSPWPTDPTVPLSGETPPGAVAAGGGESTGTARQADDDCASCLAAAACDDATTLEQCAHDHCGAVCPLMDPGGPETCGAGGGGTITLPTDCGQSGAACDAATPCCVGLTCYAPPMGCG